MTFSNVIEWLIFFILIGFGIYTLRVIKTEKANYLQNAKHIAFKKFKLIVPQWWGEVPTNTTDEIMFKRLDTRYDWEARFHWFEKRSELDLIDLFKEKINERHILFDEENSVIHNPHDFKDKPIIASGNFEMVRLEGMATADRAERLYYDAFLIREIKSGHYLYAESKSSVLNGLVEGPYFEEVMQRIELLQ